MKKILSIAAFLMFSLVAGAQIKGSEPSENVKKQVTILKKADLGLTDIQISRITTVLMGEEANQLRAEKALEGNKAQLELRMKDMHVNKINNIKGAMSEAQAEKFDALKIADKF
jgi:hypothetical protein